MLSSNTNYKQVKYNGDFSNRTRDDYKGMNHLVEIREKECCEQVNEVAYARNYEYACKPFWKHH